MAIRDILLALLDQYILSNSFALNQLKPENGSLKLNDQSASAGFMLRHMAETTDLFGFFPGLPPRFGNTTMGASDTGQGREVEESHEMLRLSLEKLREYLLTASDGELQQDIDTPFFGTVSRLRLIGHVLFHNSYHSGQIGLTLRRAEEGALPAG